MSGFVSLVGAGPGDPSLLTRRAVARLRRADLVLYDALVPDEVLAIARRAHRFYVGKRAGRHAMTQEAINALLVRAARRGRRVVRLKAGDPFVFGRGGEEALALTAAGIPFEIVPGVTSAIAAPALAGIPVTHRGLSTGFVVVSGHAVDAYTPILAGLPPQAATVVVMMGIGARQAIADLLLSTGWSGETPAAIVYGAGTRDSSTWAGSLRELGSSPHPPTDAPGTIVIGQVVTLASVLAAASPELPPAAAADDASSSEKVTHVSAR